MSVSNLRKLLDEVASNAPDISALETRNIARLIERRRQRNTIALSATTAFGLVVAVGSALAIGAHVTNESNDPTSEPPNNTPPTAGITFGQCGGYVQGVPSAASSLTVGFHGPQTVEPDERGLMRFDVTVTNRGQTAVNGITREAPEVFVTRNRTVVAMPLARRAVGVPFDLAAGQAVSLHAAANLRPCNQLGAARSTLKPGKYELFIRYVVSKLDANHLMTGETIEAQGGPWSILIT